MSAGTTNWAGASLSGGRYRVAEELGRGGMARVYRARDRKLGTDVVIKVPLHELARLPDFTVRFRREIRALVNLAHPHIVRVLDFGEFDDAQFAVLQFLGGGSLEDRRPRGETGQTLAVDHGSLARWLPDIADALDFMHRKGFVHRDVKPANILFDDDGHAYLSDFGIAKALAQSSAHPNTQTLTGTGLVIGTPEYLAPEIINGNPYDGRVDQYALGVTIYELISGTRPFEGRTPAAVLVNQATTQPPNLAHVNPVIPEPLSIAVQKSLEKRPDDRFADCRALASAIGNAQSSGVVDAINSLPSVATHSKLRRRRPSRATSVVDTNEHSLIAAAIETTSSASDRIIGSRTKRRRPRALFGEKLLGIIRFWTGKASEFLDSTIKTVCGKNNIILRNFVRWFVITSPLTVVVAVLVLTLLFSWMGNEYDHEKTLAPKKHVVSSINFPSGEWVDVLPLVEVSRHGVHGEWTRHRGAVVSDLEFNSRLVIPVIIAGNYDLSIQCTPLEGADSFGAILPVGEHNCLLELSADRGRTNRIAMIDETYDNSTVRRRQICNKRTIRLDITVRLGPNATLRVELDGRPFIEWEGAEERLTCPRNRHLPQPGIPALASYKRQVRFEAVKLRKVSGQFTPLDVVVANRQLPLTSSRPQYIPRDAIQWQGNYYYFSEATVPFEEAQRIAKANNGRLLLIGSQDENEFVAKHARAPTFLGLVRKGNESNYLSDRFRLQRYFVWHPGQPECGIDETLVGFDPADDRWHDYHCEERLHYCIEWGSELDDHVTPIATATRRELRSRDTMGAPPFRIPVNGISGMDYLDPISFGPDWLGFNSMATPDPWEGNDVFARLATKGCLTYPALPTSRYVFETEVEFLARDGGLRICLGDPWYASHLNLYWKKDKEKIECTLAEWGHGWWGWAGHRDFDRGQRLLFKIVVGDGRQELFLENNRILGIGSPWPTDLCLRIWSESPDSAIIHRAAFRPLTDEDSMSSGWTMPPTIIQGDPKASGERLRKMIDNLSWQPATGNAFLVGSAGTPMKWIEPGEFEMGSGEPQDEGRHRVRITRGFWMAQTEVTQGAFKKILRTNPSRIRGSDYLPVDWVSWEDAVAYCQRINDLENQAGRLPSGFEYRLPTEAEWEYACRAGSEKDYSASVLSREHTVRMPREVATQSPNRWGLYDMHGNAMEWCLDAWYEYPKNSNKTSLNPYHPRKTARDSTVVRGGSWYFAADRCTSHWRAKNLSSANGFLGFRIVLATKLH